MKKVLVLLVTVGVLFVFAGGAFADPQTAADDPYTPDIVIHGNV